MSKFIWALVVTSTVGFGASRPLPAKKQRHKKKSLTTAQLYKKGPFLGGSSIAAPSTLVF